MLAETVVQRLRDVADTGHRYKRVHAFISAPNGFSFFLGQHQQAIGPTTLYEFDFENKRGGGYTPGIMVGNEGAGQGAGESFAC
jgi:SMODS-associated and fused to various effectors sensor domain